MIAYLGGFSPHKNLEALVRAFGRLAGQRELSDVRLVMVGDIGRRILQILRNVQFRGQRS